MVRGLLFFLTLFYTTGLCAQHKRIYLFPGLGADAALFSKTILPGCDTTIINMPVPLKNETMHAYALRIATQVDTTAPYTFIGVSLGGMVAVEMAGFLKPEKIILISSAKARKELPLRYKFQEVVPVYTVFSGKFYKRMSNIMRPLVEPESRKDDSLFTAMIERKDPLFMKRAIGMICKWNPEPNRSDIIHFHGTSDHTLPYRFTKNAIKIKKGSHMMTYSRAQEVNKQLNLILQDYCN